LETVFQFALLGLGAGALYGIAALGLVLVYRGSGVINFAHGAIGMVGTFAFYELHEVRNWSFVASAVPALLVCAALGVIIQLLIMAPLRNSSGLTKLLATLGVLTTLQGLASLRYKSESVIVTSSLPRDTVSIAGATIGADRLLIFAIVVVLAAILYVVYRYTKFGIATSAVAENPRTAARLGYSPNAIACANWALGSMLAGVAGILLAPITGLSVTGLTLLVVPALAAAVVGGMVSFPITLAAGIVMGIVQAEMTHYVTTPGWSDAVPFFVIIIVLSLRGTSLPTRGSTSQRMPSVGTGRVRWWLVAAVVAVAVLIVQTASVQWVDGITTTLTIAIVVLSVVVVTGYAGQVSLAQWSLAGLGAFIAATLVASAGLTFLPALLLTLVCMIPIGIMVGLPALRSRGDQLAIITLGVTVALQQLLFNNPSLTGRGNGLSIGFATLFGQPVDAILHPQRYAIVVIVFFTLCALAVANLRRGRVGRRMLALRSNERAAASLGISVQGSKLYAFALAGVIAAVGGVLFAFRNPSATFTDFAPFNSVTLVGYAVIGGLGYTAGPLVGSLLEPGGLGTVIGDLLGEDFQRFFLTGGGILLIVTVIFNVDGIVASEIRRWSRVGRRVAGRARRSRDAAADAGRKSASAGAVDRARQESSPDEHVKVAPRVLAVTDIAVRFGVTDVLKGVSLEVRPGSIVGLIGPNGAGKTTLIDVITGYVTPRGGSVSLDGAPVPRAAHARARAGIARSYQSLELFDDMTVMENLRVAAERSRPWHYLTDPFFPGRPAVTAEMARAIDVFQLGDVLDRRPSELPYGQRRLVAIARAVASEPSVLLLDEPAAGLSETERTELAELVRHLARDRGLAILLIEHDVELVMSLCEEVVALDFGRVIASGPPDKMRNDPDVIASYLGAETHGDDDEGAAAVEPVTAGSTAASSLEREFHA
jgi:ABC-type branched-subunit amino acid transport system ATPase component/branched-subunit amino acid ABC-type transport system permease component